MMAPCRIDANSTGKERRHICTKLELYNFTHENPKNTFKFQLSK